MHLSSDSQTGSCWFSQRSSVLSVHSILSDRFICSSGSLSHSLPPSICLLPSLPSSADLDLVASSSEVKPLLRSLWSPRWRFSTGGRRSKRTRFIINLTIYFLPRRDRKWARVIIFVMWNKCRGPCDSKLQEIQRSLLPCYLIQCANTFNIVTKYQPTSP